MRWAERTIDSAESEKAYSRSPLTACTHSEGSSEAQVELQSEQKVSGPLPATPRYTFKSGDGRDLPKEMFIMGAEWLPHHCLQWCVAVTCNWVQIDVAEAIKQAPSLVSKVETSCVVLES